MNTTVNPFENHTIIHAYNITLIKQSEAGRFATLFFTFFIISILAIWAIIEGVELAFILYNDRKERKEATFYEDNYLSNTSNIIKNTNKDSKVSFEKETETEKLSKKE